MKTLKERLVDWGGMDVASHELAIVLGVVLDEKGSPQKIKDLFWSSNPFSDMLYTALYEMLEIGMLEKDEGQEHIRWNPNYKPSMLN